MFEFLAVPWAQRALLTTLIVALACASLGVFLVLRRMALLAQGLGHLALGGIGLGLFLGLPPVLAALGSVVAGAFGLQALGHLRLSSETAIAILFSAGMAIGILFLALAGGAQTDFFTYLFGTVLGVGELDFQLTLLLGGAVLLLIWLLRKEWLFLTFDPASAQVAGLPVARLQALFTLMVGLTVALAAKAVGLLLVSSLMVIPAAAAIGLRRPFHQTLLLCNALAVLGTLMGFWAAWQFDLPPGATIIAASLLLFLLASAYRWLAHRPTPKRPVPKPWFHRH